MDQIEADGFRTVYPQTAGIPAVLWHERGYAVMSVAAKHADAIKRLTSLAQFYKNCGLNETADACLTGALAVGDWLLAEGRPPQPPAFDYRSMAHALMPEIAA